VSAGGGNETLEASFLDRCRRGDRHACRELVTQYERRVYSIAFGFVRNREDALDLTQDVFVKVFRNLDGFQGASSFYTWLYRIAVNVCIDHIRRKKRRREDTDYDDTLAHDNAAEMETPVVSSSTGISPSRLVVNKELGSKISDSLEKLSDAHKEILLLREVEGLSYEELAEVLHIPKGTVMSRLFHARANLQKRLVDYLGE
jgi:RNA polymerase sigma-70 factor (ECF subfamily)